LLCKVGTKVAVIVAGNNITFDHDFMTYTVGKLAELIGGSVKGDSSIQIIGAAGLDRATTGEITFLSNDKYISETEKTAASAILVHQKYADKSFTIPTISVSNVYTALAEILTLFDSAQGRNAGVSPMAFCHPEAEVHETVYIGAFSILEDGVSVDSNTHILGQVYLGTNVQIGKNCIIYPGVKIYKDCQIGDNCILHSNVIIGSDGFGFAPQQDGTFVKIPQIGNVIIEDEVEIGANTVVDRATMGATLLKKGVKLDNLIQVAHNVEIGENTVIAAQAGIAGSTRLGAQCQVGGQAGIVGHIHLADGTMIQAQSGVTRSTKEPGTKLYGSPALDYGNYLQSYAVFKNLKALQARMKQMERQLKALDNVDEDKAAD